MAIRQAKYIDITSGVGAANAVTEREMTGRVFTTNSLCGYGHIYEFTDADSVMEYFGVDSAEYKYAAKYFGFISKSVTQAKRLSFARWTPTASAPYIKGRISADTTIASYTGSNCKLKIKVGEITHEISVTFSTPASMSDVVGAIEDAIQAYTYEETTPFATATVTLGSTGAEAGRVTITLPSTVISEIVPLIAADTTESQNDLATLMKLVAGNSPVCSNNSGAETPAEACARVDAISDNCGSFCFIGSTVPTVAQARAVATWNKAKNYKYLYVVARQGYTEADGSLVGDVLTWADSVSGVGGIVGTALWSYKAADDYVESMPMALFATTDYNRNNSTKSFMYQQNDLIQASITNDANANALDEKNVNYIGTTQAVGTLLSFSQDGNNCDGTETSVYCNEVWMKARFWTNIMNLFLAVEKVPANDTGIGMIKSVMLDTVDLAIANGTVVARRVLNIQQKTYIDQVAGYSGAWKDVYNNGYILNVSIEQDGNRYIAKYLFVYLKGDSIRKVEGSDILV